MKGVANDVAIWWLLSDIIDLHWDIRQTFHSLKKMMIFYDGELL